MSFSPAQEKLFHTPEKRGRMNTPARPTKPSRKSVLPDLKNTCDDSDNDSTSTFGEEDDDLNAGKYKYARIAPMNETPIRPLMNRELFEPALRLPKINKTVQKYDVDIDFDESSRAWRSNKLLVGEGHFAYKCASCNRRAVKGSEMCGIHRRSYSKK
jgi:hypothetical protein